MKCRRIIRTGLHMLWMSGLLFSGSVRAAAKDELQLLLRELDQTIAHSSEYTAVRERRIDSLKKELDTKPLPLRTRFDLVEQLAELYNSYQSDSTYTYLWKSLHLAEALGDNDLIVRVKSRFILNLSLSGRFYEAETFAREIRDSVHVSRQTLLHYYIAQHRKNRELAYQNSSPEKRAQLREWEFYYAQRAAQTGDTPFVSLYYTYMAMIVKKQWKAAEQVCDSLLRILPPNSHDYAKSANHKAYLFGQKGASDERLCWFIRSAIADIRSAIRDYGSLCSVSEELFKRGDVDRAMAYLNHATNDTQLFNSPSRSWREMAVLPQIMSAYSERNSRLHTMYAVLLAVILIFLGSAVAAGIYFMRQNRKLHVAHRSLRQTNDRLNELTRHLREINGQLNHQNLRIADANRIKEIYIGGLLQIISEYINKLSASYTHVNKMLRNGRIDELRHEYVRSNIRNDELKEFYELFDRTFLQLFPSFVEEMNNLLDEEARPRIEAKDGSLTTVLRIFALIRLGVTETTTIASLLHCSIHTVYNYRSYTRRHARPGTGDFELCVQSIGLQDMLNSPNNPEKS